MDDKQDGNGDADANKRARTDDGSAGDELSTDTVKVTQMVGYSFQLLVVSVPVQEAVVENTVLLETFSFQAFD